MRTFALQSVVERRLLVNYRVEREPLAQLLPAGLRPQLVHGWAVAGICLLRLGRVRPHALPGRWGLGSENAAHRIAVEWDTPDGPASGVYIHRRDSASLANVIAGGRVFPGAHGHARFDVTETASSLQVRCATTDGSTWADVAGAIVPELPASRLFADVAEASEFFRRGSDGYSTARTGGLDGMRLCTDSWRVRPVQIDYARSSFFEDATRFPHGTATLDCALVMTAVPARWEPLPPLALAPVAG